MAEADLNSFLAVAEELEVKGLACGRNLFEDNANQQPKSHQTKQGWSNSENNNADEALPVESESEFSQMVKTSQAPVEETDQYEGYYDQQKGEGVDPEVNISSYIFLFPINTESFLKLYNFHNTYQNFFIIKFAFRNTVYFQFCFFCYVNNWLIISR